MSKWLIPFGAALLLCAGGSASAAPELTCVSIRSSAPSMGFGYAHMATILNGCEQAVHCEVWTDVDPQPRHAVDLEPKASTELTFRRGSPAYQFRVFASCQRR